MNSRLAVVHNPMGWWHIYIEKRKIGQTQVDVDMLGAGGQRECADESGEIDDLMSAYG